MKTNIKSGGENKPFICMVPKVQSCALGDTLAVETCREKLILAAVVIKCLISKEGTTTAADWKYLIRRGIESPREKHLAVCLVFLFWRAHRN